MKLTFFIWDRTPDGDFLKRRPALGSLILLMLCSAAAFAQNGAQQITVDPSFTVRVTHLLGFEDAPNNANGILSLQDNVLQFQKNGKPAVRLKTDCIQDVFLGEQSKQVGGTPMTLGKAATPYGGGRVISLFAHKKYDTLALEYVDRHGGVHGAIFQLNKGQGDTLRNELVASGAHITPRETEPTKKTTAEVASENK